MKYLTILISLLSLRLLGQSSFTNNIVLGIPDGNPVGIVEQLNVSGLIGTVNDVTVQLDITGGFNGDLYAYLVDPEGHQAVLLNRVGLSGSNPFGYSDSGFNITLAAVGNDVHSYQGFSPTYSGGQLTGTWAADGRNIDPQSAGSLFDTTSPTTGLAIYNGLDGGGLNGTWTLFVADSVPGGGNATFQNAVLSIMTVPEPQTLTLSLIGGALMWVIIRRRVSSP